MGPETIKDISKWEYDGGWQTIINELVNNNFDVYNVSYENTLNLQNSKGFHGNNDINVSLNHILESRFFIDYFL